jgi:hypothetical protein
MVTSQATDWEAMNEKKSPLALILGGEKIFSETPIGGQATALVDRPGTFPAMDRRSAIVQTQRNAAQPSRFPPPIPCLLCDAPAIWESIYSPQDSPQFACLGCEPPPSKSLMRARWWLVTFTDSDGVDRLTWVPYLHGPPTAEELAIQDHARKRRSREPQSKVEAAWDQFWSNPRLVESVELEWLDDGYPRVRSRTWTIAPRTRHGDEMLEAAKKRPVNRWAKR